MNSARIRRGFGVIHTVVFAGFQSVRFESFSLKVAGCVTVRVFLVFICALGLHRSLERSYRLVTIRLAVNSDDYSSNES